MELFGDKERYQATLKLCQHLEFGPFLQQSRELLRRHSPLEKILLAGFSPSSGVMTVICLADRDGIREIGGKLSVPVEAVKGLSGMGAPISMLKRASASIPARLLIERGFLTGDASLIVVRMVLGRHHIGLLFCSAEPGREFGREHGRLLNELRPVISLGLGNCLHYRSLSGRHQRLKEDLAHLVGHRLASEDNEVIGASMGLRQVMQDVRRLAQQEVVVGMYGEPGSGRQFMARKIHALSARQDKPFILINCNQIPERQIETQLFGREDPETIALGSQRQGLLQRASGGTVYLLGSFRMPGSARERLLRCLRHREISYGRNEKVRCDIRLIVLLEDWGEEAAAWSRELAAETVILPPLRDRREDIPRLVAYFTERACRRFSRLPVLEADREDLQRCLEYRWPGNVRELEIVIERAVLLAGTDGSLRLADLLPGESAAPAASPVSPEELELDTLMRNHIIRVLNLTGGKVGGEDGAAARMGINPSTLRKRMRKLKIPFGRKVRYGT